jgi:Uma2 family endonuclease
MSRRPRILTRRERGRPAIWDDLDEVSEGYIGEIVAGEIVVTPRPNAPHMKAAGELTHALGSPFHKGIGGPGGWVIYEEPRIRFGEDVRVPDLAGWRKERWTDPPRKGPLTIVPDWTCEVLSERTKADDITVKLPLYARAKVLHAWLIDPDARTLEVYRLEGDRWFLAATHAGEARVRAEPFDAVELDLSLLWLPPEPDEEDL